MAEMQMKKKKLGTINMCSVNLATGYAKYVQ